MGLALDAQSFLLAAYVTDLTAADEAPYLTQQIRFSLGEGWGSSVWYENDFITAYAQADRPLCLSREGGLFDATTGLLLDRPDVDATTHFNGLAAIPGMVFMAGDNGRYWVGSVGAMRYIENADHRPMPTLQSDLSERIEWGRMMQQVFVACALGASDFLLGGARGFLVRYTRGRWQRYDLPVEAHVTGLVLLPDGSIGICGHSPTTFIAKMDRLGQISLLYSSQSGLRIRTPRLHDGKILVAASGSEGGIFYLEGGALLPAPFHDRRTHGQARHLETAQGVLWAVCERALVRVQEGDWQSYHHPEAG